MLEKKDKNFFELPEVKIKQMQKKEKAKNDYKAIKERQGKPSSISDLSEQIQKLEEILGL